MSEIWVGPNETYKRLSDALNAAASGDVIYVRAGVYENDFAKISKSVSIVGVDGRAHFKATELIPNGKGIFVTNANVTFENVEFSGARVADRNGAGIRAETGDLTLKNCYFHDNENGVMTAQSASMDVRILNSEFARNGVGDGYTHGVYAGQIGSLTVQDSYFHDTKAGHHVKSRAMATTVEDSKLIDGTGKSSYAIDTPNGGVVLIRGNYIEQAADVGNRTIVNYGDQISHSSNSLLVDGNDFVNYAWSATGVKNWSSVSAKVVNNGFQNVSKYLDGSGSQSGNVNGSVLGDPTPTEPTPTDPTPTDPTPTEPTPTDPTPTDDLITVRVSGDHYQGAPEFKLIVDGKQVGATTTVTADHKAGEWQEFKFSADLGANSVVKVEFINNLYGGSPSADRNLWVDWIDVDGQRFEASSGVLVVDGATSPGREYVSKNGALVFTVDGGGDPAPAPDGPETVKLRLSGDQYEGAPEFKLLVDGVEVARDKVYAVHAKGEWTDFVFQTEMSDANDLQIVYTNNLWGGSSSKDRNLWVDHVEIDGLRFDVSGATLEVDGVTSSATNRMSKNGTMTFDVAGFEEQVADDASLIGVAPATTDWS